MTQELRGKVVAITGGSRGFGLAIAQRLLELNARVGLVSRGRESLEEAAAALNSEHVFTVIGDVGKAGDIQSALTAIKTHFGRLDALVNNAGLARPNAIEHLKEDEVQMQVQTNFLGTVFAAQAAIPLLRGGTNPRIINVSSASAHHYDEMSHLSIYASTKAAVERFSRDLREELQADGIGVTCLRPGAAWTSFSEGWDAAAVQAGFAAWTDQGTYMDTGMEVRQVADAVVYALVQPPGVAVDLLEIRPNVLTPKNG